MRFVRMKYKHLFFDLDHTLWDFDRNAKETLQEIHRDFELTGRGVPHFEAFYATYKQHNEIMWDRYHKGFITQEELKWKRMWRTLLDFKVADEALSKKLSASFLQLLPEKKQLFPYTAEILHYLSEKKYQMHIITNGFEHTQKSKIGNSGIDRFFRHVITSEASNSLKPKKEIFDFAIGKSGAVLEESIMIGDNPEADIQGAINAGMDSIFVNHTDAEIKVKPTYTVNHLQELENIL